MILISLHAARGRVRRMTEDVHVGVVEILCLGDGAYPAIPPSKSLLGGVAMEMRVSCCLCSSRTPGGSDTEEEEGTSIKYLTASTDATASCCSPASVWIHVVDSAEEIHAADVNHPICGHLQLGNEAGLCDARVGEERSLRHR